MDTKTVYDIINSLKVSDGWKDTFKKIFVSYYHNFYQGKANNIYLWNYSRHIRGLSASDRFKFFTRFNFFALVFGPLYYLAKFMLVKGILLLLIEIALIYHYGFPVAYLAILIHIYTAIYANTDYFTKLVLNDREVKNNPSILSDMVDDAYLKSVLKRHSLYVPFCLFVAIALIGAGLYIYTDISNDIKYQNFVNQTKRVCSTDKECEAVIQKSVSNIRTKKDNLHKEYFNLAEAYYLLGNKQASLKALGQSLLKKPDYLLPYLLRGIIYTEQRQFAEARGSYETALKIHPKGKFLYYFIGSSYYKEGKYGLAKVNFEKAVKAYPHKALYLEALAYTKIYLKDNKGAKEDLKKAVRELKNEGETKNSARIEALEGYMKNLK